jgi:protein TonB
VSAKATPWVFPEGAILPVVSGDVHPLKRFGRRLLIRGIIIAGLLHLSLFGGWLMARTMKPEPPPAAYTLDVTVKTIKSYQDLGVPPSLAQTDDIAVATEVAVAAAPSIGVPEPVPDFQATTQSLATATQIAEALTPVEMSDLNPGADSLVIDESIFDPESNEPVSISAVQELPVPISTPLPVYPDMARMGGAEGQVLVRILITREGKVSEAVVVEGNMLLHEAAIAAVKQWTFKPALQQHRPVAVRVDVPLDFSLD